MRGGIDGKNGLTPRDFPREIPREIPRKILREIPREILREFPREIPREIPWKIWSEILKTQLHISWKFFLTLLVILKELKLNKSLLGMG